MGLRQMFRERWFQTRAFPKSTNTDKIGGNFDAYCTSIERIDLP
jgi:hypothetical protein